MSEKDIIKALECCGVNQSCEGCPFKNKGFCVGTVHALLTAAHDLVNRQKAEIERLEKENNQFADIGKMYSEIKSEAITDFAERLKKKAYLFPCAIGVEHAVTIRAINDLVEEMKGKTNETD